MADVTKNPKGIVPSEESVKLFNQIMADVYTRVSDELDESTIYQQKRKKQILENIEKIVNEGSEDLKAWMKTQVPGFYSEGIENAINDVAKRDGIKNYNSSYAGYHKEAVEALVNEGYSSIAKSMTTITADAERKINEAIRANLLNKIAVGQITGDSKTAIQKEIKKNLLSQGIVGLVDKGGKTWDLKRYGEMLARTRLVQATNSGIINEAAAQGDDLVRVSSHYGSCPLCMPWQNEILSTTGKNSKYRTVKEAEFAGLFHPNCRHRLFIYSNFGESQLKVWDTERQTYVDYSDLASRNFQRTAYNSTVVNNNNLFKYNKGTLIGDNIRRATTDMEKIYSQNPKYGIEPFSDKQLKHIISDYVGGIKLDMADYLPKTDIEEYFYKTLKKENIKDLGTLAKKFDQLTTSLSIPRDTLDETIKKLVNNAYYSDKVKSEIEKIYVMNERGYLTFSAAGSSRQVSIPSNISLKDKISIHNHPKDSSFSLQDMYVMMKTNEKESRVYTDSHVYTLTRAGKEWGASKQELEYFYNQAKKDVLDNLKGGENETTVYNQVVQKTAESLGWNYKVERRK